MAEVKMLSDVRLKGALIFGKETTEFPANPRRGETVFKDGVLWIWTSISGYEAWFPLTRPKSSYIHVQGLPALTWTVNHNLNSNDIIVGVYDTTGAIVAAAVQSTSLNAVTVTFSEETSGKAVVFCDADFASVNSESITTGTLTVTTGNVVIDENGLTVAGAPVVTETTDGTIGGLLL